MISSAELNHEGESKPIIGATEERQEDVSITRFSRSGHPAVDDKTNVGFGSSEDLPNIVRIDCFRRTVGRDGPLKQVVEWIESGGTGRVVAPCDLQGNQQHLRRGLFDVSRDAIGEFVVVDNGNVCLDGDVVESSEGPED